MPGRLNGGRTSIAVPAAVPAPSPPRTPAERGAIERPSASAPAGAKPPLRGALLLGADDEAALANELRTALAEARQGRHLDPAAPSAAALRAPERLAIDYADGEDLIAKAEIALRMFQADTPAGWPALRARGIYRGSGAAGEGRLPVHRTGLSVPEHARRAAPSRACGLRGVRRGRRDHGAAARGTPAVGHRVRRSRRRGRARARRGRAAPHRDHTARGAHGRRRPHPPARRVRDRPRPRDGPFARRVRGAGRGRRALVRGRAGGRQRARPGDGEPGARGSRRDGGRERAARRDRRGDRRHRRLRRAGERQLDPPGRAGRRDGAGGPGRGGAPGARAPGAAAAGEPRVPHRDRGAGERAAARDAAAAWA